MAKLLRVVELVLVVFLLLGAVTFVLQACHTLTTPGEVEYGEGIVLWQAANVTNWTKAFHPVEVYPHVIFHYTPLFHLTSRFVALFTGDLLVAGRLVSILSLAGTCLIGALLTASVLPGGRDRFARFVGSVAAGTLVFTSAFWWWETVMRVDALAIFLSVAGVALFVAARRHRALGFLAFLFFVAAVYTKQTSLAAPAACFILAFIEKPRYALQLAAFSVSLGLVILLMLHTATDGLFLRHIVTYNQNPYLLTGLFDKLQRHARTMAAPLFFATVFPLGFVYSRIGYGRKLIDTLRSILTQSGFERCVVVVGLYFFFAAILAAATISKLGAYDNYFIEMDAVASLSSGLFLGWLLRHDSFRPASRHLIIEALVILLFFVQAFGNVDALRRAAATCANPPVDYSPQVVEFLKTLPDPIYSEDMVVLMQAGKEIPAEPAIISTLALDGKWDERGFVARIQRGEFHAIVIRNTLQNDYRFSKAVQQAILEHYYPTNNIGIFQIYLPKVKTPLNAPGS